MGLRIHTEPFEAFANVEMQRSGYTMISDDDDDSDEDADACDAREVAEVDEDCDDDDEHVSAEFIGPALAGIGLPDTNAAVAAKEGAEAARVHQDHEMRRSWLKAECREII